MDRAAAPALPPTGAVRAHDVLPVSHATPRVPILDGPNPNPLGRREPEVCGRTTTPAELAAARVRGAPRAAYPLGRGWAAGAGVRGDVAARGHA